MNLKARPKTWLVWLALWIVYIVWGSTYLAIRVTVETIPPLLSAGIRFLVAGGVLYLFLRVRRGKEGVRVTGRQLGAATMIGAALLLGGNGLVAIAERDVPSGLAALIIASVPLWVVVLRSIFEDGVDRGTIAGVVVGFIGVAILMLPGERPDGAPLVGMLMVVAASIFWASGSFFSRRVSLPPDPFLATAVEMIMGGVILVVAGAITGEFGDFRPSEFSVASLLGVGYLITFGSWLAFTAYTWLLQNAPISKVATYAYVNPVIAILLGSWFLSETITTTVLVGAAVIVASVAYIVRRESSSPRTIESVEPLPGGAATALEPSRS